MDYQKINQIQEHCLHSEFLKKKRLYLNWETGTGKTHFMGKLCSYFVSQKKKILFLGPAGIYNSIKESFKKNGLTDYEILDSDYSRKGFLYGKKSKASVIVMSWQCFSLEGYYNKIISDYDFDLVIFDEAHHLNGEKTGISKKFKLFCDKKEPEYLLMGSGTPFGNNELELFNVMYCLDKRVFSPSRKTFEIKYFVDVNKYTNQNFKKYKIRDDHKAIFYKKIAPYFSYLKLKDITTQLPAVQRKMIRLDMTDEQKKVYRDLKSRFKIDMIYHKKILQKNLDNNINKGQAFIQFYSSVLSQMMALRQVCNGFVYEYIDVKGLSTEEIKRRKKNRGVMKIKTHKLERLQEGLKKSIPIGKALVWTIFKETYNDIEKMLNESDIGYVMVTGGMTHKKRQEAIESFHNNPFKKVFLSHPICGGTGLNLQNAKFSVSYSSGYSFIEDKQKRGRNYRVDSIRFNQSIGYIDMIIRGSIEEVITHRVKTKADACKAFMSYLNY